MLYTCAKEFDFMEAEVCTSDWLLFILTLDIILLKWGCNDSNHYLQLFVGGCMSYLHYLFLFVYSGVQHILCFVFLRLVYPILPVSLDYPFLISPSVFSNVYLIRFTCISMYVFKVYHQ
jgi:hypothetical protein